MLLALLPYSLPGLSVVCGQVGMAKGGLWQVCPWQPVILKIFEDGSEQALC